MFRYAIILWGKAKLTRWNYFEVISISNQFFNKNSLQKQFRGM